MLLDTPKFLRGLRELKNVFESRVKAQKLGERRLFKYDIYVEV